jgi:hypothetical protein
LLAPKFGQRRRAGLLNDGQGTHPWLDPAFQRLNGHPLVDHQTARLEERYQYDEASSHVAYQLDYTPALLS